MIESTNTLQVLDDIAVNLQAAEVLKRLRMRSENKRVEEMVGELAQAVTATARPKAAYKMARITARDGDVTRIDDFEFECHAFRVFDKAQPVFPYVVTCGRELDTLKFPQGEAMKTYCLTVIKGMIATTTTAYLEDHLTRIYDTEHLSGIIPGHPITWPIKQTKTVVSLLGNVEDAIGVRISDTFVLIPANSVAGILYPTKTRLERCHICPNETCRDRKTTYNPAALE